MTSEACLLLLLLLLAWVGWYIILLSVLIHRQQTVPLCSRYGPSSQRYRAQRHGNVRSVSICQLPAYPGNRLITSQHYAQPARVTASTFACRAPQHDLRLYFRKRHRAYIKVG